MLSSSYLGRSGVEGGRDGDLVLRARGDVEGPLPDDGHVEVVDDGDLEPLGALVVVAVVEGLDVEEDGEAVVLAGLGALGHGVEPEGPVGVGAVGDGGEVELGRVPAADAVVGAEVALVVAEAVGRRAVPLRGGGRRK